MMKNKLQTENESLKKLAELIQDIKVAMLTTTTPNGVLQSRPMMAQEVDDEGCLWFFTSARADKAAEIRNDQHVNLSYSEPRDSKYVSVSGTASLVSDRSKAEELYTPFLKAWFPDGLASPDLILIKVKIETAEYWDAPMGKMVQFLKMATAAFTGNPYPPQAREHEKVRVNDEIKHHH